MNTPTKRLLPWALGIALLLIIPLVLTMRDGAVEGVGWNWTGFDFVWAFVVLFGARVVYEVVVRKSRSLGGAHGGRFYRTAAGLAVLTALVFVWINAAVGIIGGGELDVPNALYFGVLLLGLVGALVARFRPKGMSYTLFAMALAQFIVPLIALLIWPPSVTSWAPGVLQVFLLNGVFVLLFVGSGLLFRRAS